MNLVSNGSFETGIAPWQPMAPYSRLVVTRTPHLFGEKALLVLPTSARVPYFGAQTIIGHPSYHNSYRAEVWVRGRHGTSVQVVLYVVKPAANSTGWAVVVLASRTRRLTGGWQRLSVRGTVTARTASTLNLQIRSHGAVKRWSRLAVDGIEVN